MDGTILPGMGDIFILGFPVIVGEEVLVYNGIDVGVSRGFNSWSSEARFMSLSFYRVLRFLFSSLHRSSSDSLSVGLTSYHPARMSYA